MVGPKEDHGWNEPGIGEDLLGIDLSRGALTYQQAMIGLDALA